jgi:hypothetical protein
MPCGIGSMDAQLSVKINSFVLLVFFKVLIMACCWVWLTVEPSRPIPGEVVR